MIYHLFQVTGGLQAIYLSPTGYKLAYKLLLPYHHSTVRPVLSGHTKIDKTKVLKTIGSLMKVKSITECFKRAFCNTFDLH